MKRVLSGAVLVLALGGVCFGQAGGVAVTEGLAAGGKTVLLWPDGAPGAKGSEDIDRPALTVYLPKGPNVTRTGVVIAPGGGYKDLAIAKEGSKYALWLNERGVAAFVLQYRLGPKYHYPVELEDAQRAIRMVRAHAAEYGVDADKVGMWGSSAGGHLAATAGTHFDAGDASAADVVERQGSRPDFLILAYPVITFEEPQLHRGSLHYLLGDDPDPRLVASLSDETQVTKETPPAFLFSTTDDKTVPVMNSVMFYSALVSAGVPVEMHLFQHGGHGAGLAAANPDLSVWPELLAKWMRERGYMGKD
ncbi:alpha/beta hydrolase [Granulicella sp. L60]|uniref:alpha/beta hydrolase n=1 Tax=Granulicella sp. L60 TaxID=1641866 RepID=UPI0020B16B88|nr:alpha/beta hydrolase [Granulicella sp. L60]